MSHQKVLEFEIQGEYALRTFIIDLPIGLTFTVGVAVRRTQS
jgi:hypothetical protein